MPNLKKPLTVLAATGAILFGGPAVAAQAAPVDPTHDYVSLTDVGPYHPDWYCTYQLSVHDISCTYAPGQGQPTKQLVGKHHFGWHWHWPWS